jgi:hypothetical protein
MNGNGALGGEMGRIPSTDPFEGELATFATSVRSSLIAPVAPDPAFVARLAAEARAPAVAERPTAKPRRAFRLARVAVAVALLPLLMASLAVAGVKLPGPADEVFEKVGIELPNQASDAAEENSVNGTDDGVDEPPTGKPGEPGEKGRDNAAAKRGHGKDKSNPAREGGRSQGTQGKGRALGKDGAAPGQTNPNRGGSGNGNAIGKSDAPPPGQAQGSPGKAGEQGQGSAGGAQGGGGGNGKAGGNGNSK